MRNNRKRYLIIGTGIRLEIEALPEIVSKIVDFLQSIGIKNITTKEIIEERSGIKIIRTHKYNKKRPGGGTSPVISEKKNNKYRGLGKEKRLRGKGKQI